jgi:hypothetical protein
MRETETRTVSATLGAALLFGWVAASAADDGISTTITGYGSLGGTFTSDTQFAYHHDPTEFKGAAEQFDIGLESRLGLQAVIDFGSGFSVTAQELIRERSADEFSIGTEWLYLQYLPTSNLKLRLGRVVVGTFLFSDSRNVGYAAPWFRAPNEIYGANPVESLDGGQVLWSTNLGPVVLGLQGSFGTTSIQYLVNSGSSSGAIINIPFKNLYNLSASLEYQSFLLRVAQTVLRIPSALPLSATSSLNYVLKDSFSTVGTQYDNGRVIALAEWAIRTQNNAPIVNEKADANREWYVAGGWRFDKLTPLLIYGKFDQLNSLAGPASGHGAFSASLRYDVVHNIALKAQYSRPQASSTPYWVIPDPASNKRVNVYSLGADFVF